MKPKFATEPPKPINYAELLAKKRAAEKAAPKPASLPAPPTPPKPSAN